MANISRIAAILLFIFLFSACSSIRMGRDFDVGMFAARIEHGVTTQSQVRSWLGEPTIAGASLDTSGERFDEWVYYFAEGTMADMSATKVKTLQIKFDKQGKVRGYNWSASRQ